MADDEQIAEYGADLRAWIERVRDKLGIARRGSADQGTRDYWRGYEAALTRDYWRGYEAALNDLERRLDTLDAAQNDDRYGADNG